MNMIMLLIWVFILMILDVLIECMNKLEIEEDAYYLDDITHWVFIQKCDIFENIVFIRFM
jgi:hypothetical protein